MNINGGTGSLAIICRNQKKPEEGCKLQSQKASFKLSHRAKFQKENQGVEV
jgi:hypothetical protein